MSTKNHQGGVNDNTDGADSKMFEVRGSYCAGYCTPADCTLLSTLENEKDFEIELSLSLTLFFLLRFASF